MIIWIQGQNPCLKMTEENVVKRWFVVKLYAETQLEIVAGFDKHSPTPDAVLVDLDPKEVRSLCLRLLPALYQNCNLLSLYVATSHRKAWQVFRSVLHYYGEKISSVSRWCHVKWPSSEPAPDASRDWQETKLWLQQLWLEARVWSSESEITCSTEKRKKKQRPPKNLVVTTASNYPNAPCVKHDRWSPPDGNRTLPCTHPDTMH